MSQYGAPKPHVWGQRGTYFSRISTMFAFTYFTGLAAGSLLTPGQIPMGMNAAQLGMVNLGGMVNQAAFGATQVRYYFLFF